MSFDLKISWNSEGEVKETTDSIILKISDEIMKEKGQHGSAIILESINSDDKWLLKIFNNIIDKETNEIPFLDVDLSGDPEKMKSRLQFWRALNEYSASLLAYELTLPVPVCYLVTSRKINNFELEKNTVIPLDDDEIVLDDELGAPETADEFYYLSERENYVLETSDKFEDLLKSKSISNDATSVIGVLTRMVPNSTSLQAYFDNEDFDTVISRISNLDDSFSLIPFDTWLNDPDRNQGNYLVHFDESNKPINLIGIDYEMWSFGNDIWMDQDEITKGRSYLTAVVHKSTNFFDDRILETFYKISTMSDADIDYLTAAPAVICKLMEYHIQEGNLNSDERFKLLQMEENNRDFLYETIPKIDKLGLRLIRQIGLPSKIKELEEKVLDIDEDEFFYKGFDETDDAIEEGDEDENDNENEED